ncbi:MAG: peptidoglycan editing factor PgeF [bacterium]
MRLVSSENLAAISWLRHGLVGPSWVDGEPDSADNLSFTSGPESLVRAARARAGELLGVDPGYFTHVYQVHGSTVLHVTIADRGKGSSPNIPQIGQGDAMITADPWLPIAILVADCIPVFLVDRSRRAIGLAHAGWRGTAASIGAETVRAMHRQFGTEPQDILAWIGPGISRCCFEVGPEVIEQFESAFPNWNDCWSVSPRRIDLKEINRRILQSAGILRENIDMSEDCTMCDPGYFSYRRMGPSAGHNMCAIMIVE